MKLQHAAAIQNRLMVVKRAVFCGTVGMLQAGICSSPHEQGKKYAQDA
jgi:hypothetical protein